MSDKNEILDEISPILDKNSHFGIGFLLQALLVIFMILLFVFPRLYLQHEIYYKSRKIARLQSQYRNLQAQHFIISNKVEVMTFHNQITNTIF